MESTFQLTNLLKRIPPVIYSEEFLKFINRFLWEQWWLVATNMIAVYTAQKMKFSIKDLSSKCDQICSFLRIWSHLPKKSLIENFIFCAVMYFFFFFTHLKFFCQYFYFGISFLILYRKTSIWFLLFNFMFTSIIISLLFYLI